MSDKNYLSWGSDLVYWSGGEIDFTWSEVFILETVNDAIISGGGPGMIPDIDPFEWLEKKVDSKVSERFRKILLRVNGLEKIKDPNKEIKVTAEHIRNTIRIFSTKVTVNVKEKISVSLSKDTEI